LYYGSSSQPKESDMQLDNMKAVREPVPMAGALLITGLIGLDVLAQLLPHAPNFTPVAASALFASLILRRPALAFLVPLAAMLLRDSLLGFDDWRITIAIYGSLMIPAALGILPRWRPAPLLVFALTAASSIAFYAITNFAVWMFSGMYPQDGAGLLGCYVAALPFFRNTFAGDLFWITALFAALWVWRLALTARGVPADAYTELPGR
jgi:hypothetical protein